jgi:agmatine deiminase
MPAEWTPHAATWMAWPHDDEQWVGMLEPVRREFAAFVEAIAVREPVQLLLADDESEADARRRLGRGTVRFHRVPHQDLWLRDSGPTFLVRRVAAELPPSRQASADHRSLGEGGHPRDREVLLVDWDFNGWGEKYPADLDNQIPIQVARILGGVPLHSPKVVMEGGSIEVDGCGTVLTTRQCLLSPHRNPGMAEAELEACLRDNLGVRQVIWLDEGLEGDHTDGHIDTITRFTDERTIVTATCDDRDDANHAVLAANLERLRSFRDVEGRAYRIVELPIPRNSAHFEGERLPLTYANFYIVNGAVLVPVYGDEHDASAIEILRPLFPGREMVPLTARALITGGGAFHCVTQQQPVGDLWRGE